MKILLFGANGQVGHELRRSLAPVGTVVCTTRSGSLGDGTRCETADFDAPGTLPALVDRIAPDLVVNAAAWTAVDRAEAERDAVFRANADAPREIAAACARRGIRMVQYSTDYVFDGASTRPYREDDPTAPLGIYGTSKLEGERAVRESGAAHLILRTAWVYATHGQNFLRTMLRLAADRDELRVVADQVGTPTPAALIADVTAGILAQAPPLHGTWHLTATGSTSWHGFATAIFERAHARGLLARVPRVLPITTADYPTAARRPASSVLDTRGLAAATGIELPAWQAALDQVLASIDRTGMIPMPVA